MFKKLVLPWLAWLLYRVLSLSWRKQLIIAPEVQKAFSNKEPVLLAHWHGHELAVLHLVKTFQLATMTSTSKDGEIIDYVIKKMGGATSRGSSTRGGVGALKGLVRLIRQGRIASIAVDGPRGPIHQVKPGIFEISRITQAIIVPVGVFVEKPFVFKKSWNQAILPLPFQKVYMTFGQPMDAIPKGALAKDIKLAEKLREMLFLEQKKAAKLIAAQ